MKKVAVLLSGRGSNFIALSDAINRGEIQAEIVLVISNIEDAAGLDRARERGYQTLYISSRGRDREDFDREVVAALEKADVDFICLAGFMRLLSSYFVSRFPMRILNIHPALLPAFTGLHAQEQALNWGVKVAGCTVHFVDEKLDHGPIIVQKQVPVLDADTVDILSARILVQEHQAYPEALRIACEGNYTIVDRRLLLQEKE